MRDSLISYLQEMLFYNGAIFRDTFFNFQDTLVLSGN